MPNVNYSFDSDYQYYSNAIFYLEVGASLKFNYLPSDSQIEFYLKPGSTLEVTHGNIYNCAIIKSKYASFNYDKGLSFDTKQSNLLIECDDLQFAYSEAPKDGIKIMQALGYLDVPEEYNNNFNIYPNPSSNVLRFNEDYENANIKIYNISGELVFNSSYKKEIDISNFNIGTYIVSIQSANKLYTSKFEVLK